MAAYGFTVEKRGTFRGSNELFSNTYHYHLENPSNDTLQTLLDAVVTRDKAGHPNTVAYVTGRVFGPTDGPNSENQMRVVDDLSGNGTRAANGPPIYPELCAVVAMFIGRNPATGRKLFLRKYVRIFNLFSNTSNASTGSLASAEQAEFASWYQGFRSLDAGGTSYILCTPRDRQAPSDALAFCLPYAHVRQIHQ